MVKLISERYKNRKIRLINNTVNIGNFGNFRKAQQICSAKYVCILHDDDVLHPMYLKKAVEQLNQGHVLVSGSNKYYVNPSLFDFEMPNGNVEIWNREVASVLSLYVHRYTFQCAVYNTNVFKSISMCMNKEGKLWDITFLLDVMQKGSCCYFPWETIKIRYHSGQDSEINTNGPFVNELYEILVHIRRLYNKHYGVLGDLCIYNFACFIFQWSKIKELTLRKFIKELVELKVIPKGFYYLMRYHFTRKIVYVFSEKKKNKLIS